MPTTPSQDRRQMAREIRLLAGHIADALVAPGRMSDPFEPTNARLLVFLEAIRRRVEALSGVIGMEAHWQADDAARAPLREGEGDAAPL